MNLEKPVSVQSYEALQKRMVFDYNQQFRFQNIQSGMNGEFYFGRELAEQSFPQLAIYDSEFESGLCPQLDFIVVTSNKIYLYDVKNFDGIYYYENGHFRSTKQKIYSPLTQLDRAYEVLDILLQQMNTSLPIIKNLVFVNPNFTLYGNQPNLPIILRSQLDQHFKDITRNSTKLEKEHFKISEYIKSRKIKKNFYDTGINYNYDSLSKGVWCRNCDKQLSERGRKYFYCSHCHQFEIKSVAISRSLKEFKLLFPNEEINSQLLRDWCGNSISLPTARRVIAQYSK